MFTSFQCERRVDECSRQSERFHRSVEYFETMDVTNFDIDALRAFVVANDLGGYGRAAARLGRTPSAVSLQMKRLQRDVGAPLYRKDGRRTALTEIGALVLRFAREIVARNDELHDALRGAA